MPKKCVRRKESTPYQLTWLCVQIRRKTQTYIYYRECQMLRTVQPTCRRASERMDGPGETSISCPPAGNAEDSLTNAHQSPRIKYRFGRFSSCVAALCSRLTIRRVRPICQICPCARGLTRLRRPIHKSAALHLTDIKTATISLLALPSPATFETRSSLARAKNICIPTRKIRI